MRKNKVTFNGQKLQYSADLMRALAHPIRLKILEYIDENENTNVRQIYRSLDLEQSITSQHLKMLRLAGVLHSDKEGKQVRYKIDYNVIMRVKKAVERFLQE